MGVSFTEGLNDIPKGFKELPGVDGVYLSDNEIVICGRPDPEDETHNCDAMGCSSVSHVLFRCRL